MQEPFWLNKAFEQALSRLSALIETPSFSEEEHAVAELFASWMKEDGIAFSRKGNNLWAFADTNAAKPALLLNSHLDTVRPNPAWQRNPFVASIEDGKLFGLGSNDAGASLIALYTVFKQFYRDDSLPFRLVFLASAEEENSGFGGVEVALPEIGPVACAIVGEPTRMDMAIAEKGLMVLDAVVHGKAGHAAREEGVNALYLALADINTIKNFHFEQVSPLLGPVKMTVTQIEAGSQHNVVPAVCNYVVDVRCNECYTFEEILSRITPLLNATILPRSLRMRPSSIPEDHPLVVSGIRLGRKTYGSPTTSDQALMPLPSMKMGPGDSARSHQADEFIFVEELKEGISLYWKLLKGVN